MNTRNIRNLGKLITMGTILIALMFGFSAPVFAENPDLPEKAARNSSSIELASNYATLIIDRDVSTLDGSDTQWGRIKLVNPNDQFPYGNHIYPLLK